MLISKCKKLISIIGTFFYLFRYRKYLRAGRNSVVKNCKINGLGGVIVGENSQLRFCRFYFEGKNNRVVIGKNCKLNNVEIILRYGGENLVEIGDGTTFGGSVQIEASEGTTVKIGNDCMFAHQIHIMTTDHHSILDYNGQRVNKAKDIVIGDHVWIGMGSMILKGSIIPDGCVIAAKTVYMRKSDQDSNALYAGVPANRIRNGVIWERRI